MVMIFYLFIIPKSLLVYTVSPKMQSQVLVVSTATLRLGRLKLKTPFLPALMVVVRLLTMLAPPTSFIE
jgi:hypothetical protein